LALALLRGFDGCSLVDVALILDVELAEGVGEVKDLVLLELRIFPVLSASMSNLFRADEIVEEAGNPPLELEDVHGDDSRRMRRMTCLALVVERLPEILSRPRGLFVLTGSSADDTRLPRKKGDISPEIETSSRCA